MVNGQRDAQFFTTCLFLFLTLYMFLAHRAHHQERKIVSIQPLVTVTLCRRPCRVQVGSSLTLLGSGHITCMKHTNCQAYSWLTPDDGHLRCPKHVELSDKIRFWIFDASCWLFIRRLSRCTVEIHWRYILYVSFLRDILKGYYILLH